MEGSKDFSFSLYSFTYELFHPLIWRSCVNVKIVEWCAQLSSVEPLAGESGALWPITDHQWLNTVKTEELYIQSSWPLSGELVLF